MNPLDRLAQVFEKFPGIGPRQARRFVGHLLGQSDALRKALAEDIKRLGAEVRSCEKCFRWFVQGDALKSPGVKASPLCPICSSSFRDGGTLCVVEKDADLEGIERSGFKGLYFVLGGTIPLGEENGEKFIRMRELLKRAEEGTLKEVVLGLSATTEGDHTRLILQEKLIPLAEKHGFKLSSLGRGLSTGSELEYADPETIANALSSRQ